MVPEKAFITGDAFPPLAEGTLRLYSMRFCPFSQRTRLVLELKGIEYETVNVNLSNKPEWFLERNPNGQAPTLEKGDKVLYESLIVNDYLDAVFPQKKVLSSDPYRRSLDSMLVDYYGKKYIPNYYKIVFSSGKDEEAPKVLAEVLQRLEDELEKRTSTFFGGENPGYVDFMIWPWFERFGVLTHFNPGVTMQPYPRMQRWCQGMRANPAVQKCLLDTDLHLEFYRKASSKDPQAYDAGLPGAA